jgi:hypothetical protein
MRMMIALCIPAGTAHCTLHSICGDDDCEARRGGDRTRAVFGREQRGKRRPVTVRLRKQRIRQLRSKALRHLPAGCAKRPPTIRSCLLALYLRRSE